MYLKFLHVHGFKSFAHQISIDFVPGLNVIVGPNGSGKSNIIDALRWVLGDNFREVRVSQNREVIFHGAAGSRPLGMAAIETHWEEEAGLDCSIGRRMFASGESEYFFNQSRIRLRDLKEALNGHRFPVDSVGVTVVDNQRLQTLFDFRPGEKYLLFEMASGTAGQRERLTLLRSSLTRVREKMERMKERGNELALQIGRVEGLAREEKQYLAAERELHALRKGYLEWSIAFRENKIHLLQEEQMNLSRLMTALESECEVFEQLLRNGEEVMASKRHEQERFRAFQQQNREERRKMEQDLYFFLTESRQRVIKKQSARCLSAEMVRGKTLLEKKWTGLQGHPLFQENPGQMEKSEHEIQRRLGEIRLQKNSLNEQKNSCQQELSRIETSSEYIGSEIGTLRKEIVGIDSTAQSVTTRIEGAEKSMGGFQTDLDQLLGQEQVLQKKINRKKSLLQAAQQKLATYDQEGQVDDDIVQIMKQLLRMGWPGKALYALTWLFRGQRLFQSENQSHLHDDTLSGSGRGYLWDIFIPPSFYWEICSREKILDLFLSSSLPEVNFISPDGHLVYRRDGALIFPRKMVVKGRGGTFYQSFGKKINLLKSSLVRDEQSIQTFFSCQKSIEKQLIQKKSELDGLKLRSDDLAREKKKRTDRVELLLKRKKEIDNEKESVGEELARVEETVEKMDEDLTQGEEELVDLQRRIRDRQKLQAAEEKLSLEMVNWEKKQQEIETVLQGIEKNAGSFLDLIHDLRSRFQQNEIRWVGTQEQEHNLENEIKEQEESRKKYQTIWGEKNNEKQTLIRKSEKITLQKEKFTFERDELTRQYQGFIQEDGEKLVSPDISDLGLLEKMIRERDEILKKWNVRRGSIVELQELRERQRFLRDQFQVFQDALTLFEAHLARCERENQETFFHFLERVNEFFLQDFQRVFGGGQAKVNLEGTGMEIDIQIPGKKKQKFSLLSSGEKALCALCLFFGLFKAGSYPFCFFDEVDANLDHFNSLRVAELMKEFSSEHQVIIVTHQEEIMEVADRIIGVTMDEPGISQIIRFDGDSLPHLGKVVNSEK